MPNINLKRVLLSPMLADHVSVLRRTQYINDNGRVETTKQAFPRVVAVVTMAGPDDLDRLNDNQRMGRVISVVSKFRLQGPATSGSNGPQYQPDFVIWYGDTFVVATLDPYPQFGSGFTQAICYSIDSVDQQPTFNPAEAGSLQFNVERNSIWAALLTNF